MSQKKEVLIGKVIKEQETGKYQLAYKNKDGEQAVYDLKNPLTDSQVKWVTELHKQKIEVNGKECSRGHKAILTIEGDKEYLNIYPGDVKIEKKFYSFFGSTDKNGEKRITMKTMTNVMSDHEDVQKILERKPYANVFACLALEVEGKDGKKEYVQIPRGMFSPKRNNLKADEYMKRLKKSSKNIYDKLKEFGSENLKLVTFMSVCEFTGVSVKSRAGEVIDKHFLNKNEDKKDIMGFGFIPMNRYVSKNSQEESWGLQDVPTPLFYAENPMSYKIREATAEERKMFKFDEVENAVAQERAAREEEYRRNQERYESSEQKVHYTSFEEEDNDVEQVQEDEDVDMMNNDDDSPFGPSY